MSTIYSASQGPLIPNKYIIERAPIYPQVIEPPKPPVQIPQPEMETKFVVHYLPLVTTMVRHVPPPPHPR